MRFSPALLVVVSISVLGQPSAAQGRAKPSPSVAARGPEADVSRAEAALLSATTAHDSVALEKLLAPRFQLVSAYSQGEVISRRDWLHGVLDRRTNDAAIMLPPTVVVHGPGVATVTARISWVVKDPGPTPEREEYLVTDTWLLRGRVWQIATRHSSLRRPAVSP